ncbi:MAG: hypothetical protein D6816_17020 [Bacteroidetes bacterium]|nr:MAG: hypothetical protein D6816_17020 [Bacteroidota bacterium]
MSATRTEIISEALVRLGEAPISSESDRRATLLGVTPLYDRIKASLLVAHNWHFARWTADLDQYVLQTGDPDFSDRYAYVFKLPNDCLSVRFLTDRDEYFISGNRLLWTDNPTPTLVYTKEVDESLFPVWFVEALVHKLVVALVLAVTGDNSRLQVLEQQADMAVMRAMAKDDVQEFPEEMDLMRVYREDFPSRFE